MIQRRKVVSAKNMAEVEKLALIDGCDEAEFMEKAGISISDFVEYFIKESGFVSKITLLAGKGNNGGDAYVSGVKLIEKGFKVEGISPYSLEECGDLCQKQRRRFMEVGGRVDSLREIKEGLILDGLVGTGFKGKAEGVLAEAISLANNSSLPIIAIDIPSGLCGDTGVVETVAIEATSTIYLELPKIGFFLKNGWDHVGDLVKGDFGLPPRYIEKIQALAFVFEGEGVSSLLPKIERSRNKYQAGYVLAVAGSSSMTGAGALVSHAALRSGAGIVRWFYPQGLENMLSSIPLEVIKSQIEDSITELCQEMKRASSLVIGPGMGRGRDVYKKIHKILSKCTIPSVIDADALFFLAKHPSYTLPERSLLTPHTGEMKRLLDSLSLEGEFLSSCQRYADKKKTAVLVKGAPNFLFYPNEEPLILPFGNPGMATAGSGDVLSGILGSLLAQGLDTKKAAILGCFLHGLSGDLAVKDKTVFSLTASDLIDYLGKAFSYVMSNDSSL